MAKPGDVIDVPQLGVRVQFLATGGVDRTARTPRSTSSAGRRASSAPPTCTSASASSCTVLEGAMKVKLHGRTYVLASRRADHDPARHAAHAAPDRQGARARAHPPRRRARAATSSSSAWPRWTTTVSAIPSRPRLRASSPSSGESGHAARPSLKTQKRLARLFDAEYVFSDEWDVAADARGRLRRARRRHDLPALVEAGLHRRQHRRRVHATSTSRAACRTTCTRGRGRRTPSARTRSRARPTATCAVPGCGRSRAPGPAPTSASTGACTPTAGCSSSSPRSCAPRCAPTTTGRSPARSKGSSRTCRKLVRSEDPRDEGAREGEGRVHDARLRARPQARVVRARGRRGAWTWTRRPSSRRSSPTSTASSRSRSCPSSTSST